MVARCAAVSCPTSGKCQLITCPSACLPQSSTSTESSHPQWWINLSVHAMAHVRNMVILNWNKRWLEVLCRGPCWPESLLSRLLRMMVRKVSEYLWTGTRRCWRMVRSVLQAVRCNSASATHSSSYNAPHSKQYRTKYPPTSPNTTVCDNLPYLDLG